MAQDKREAQLLRMSARFLNKLSKEPKFANKFDKDPAGALQELFPQLAKVSKKDITSILDAHLKFLDAAFTTPEAKKLAELPGALLSAIRYTRSFQIAAQRYLAQRFLARSVASALLSHYFAYEYAPRVEPRPE